MRRIVMKKGTEHYVFVYRDDCEGRAAVLRQMSKWAMHPELSFTWYDVAILSLRIRTQETETEKR